MTDGDTGKPERPNANYKLSKRDNDPLAEEQLTFHYSRERRLAKAPQGVRDLYNKPKHSGFNLLRPLIADKPRAILFFTIVLMSIAILIFSIMGFFDRAYTLEGNKLEITALGYEGAAIFLIKKTISSGSPYTGAVDIGVSPASAAQEGGEYPDGEYPDGVLPVFHHRIFFSLQPQEEYRFVVPFDSPELALVIQTEKSSLKSVVKVD